MQDLWFSVQTIFPMLMMMGIGFGSRRLGWISESGARQMNSCVYHLFLPMFLFMSILDTDVHAAVDSMTLAYAFCGVLISFGLMFWLAPLFCKQRNAIGVLIQGIARSNYAIFGIPLVMMMYPGRDTSMAVMMVVVVVPLFNLLSTIALMIYGNESADWKKIVRGVLLNPLILATVAGFICWRLEVRFPEILQKPLRQMGSVTSPLSLFVLGASLNVQRARTNIRLLIIGVVGRLVLVPLVFLPVGVALGIRDASLATLIAVFASPVAVSSYTMAQQNGGDEDLAASQVAFTTTFSMVTVFLWILAFRSFGLLN